MHQAPHHLGKSPIQSPEACGDTRLRHLDDDALLRRLSAGDHAAQGAWREFLCRYSNLILHVAWRYDHDRDSVVEKYLYVCEALAADGFSVLRRYEVAPDHYRATFSTWLVVVIRNLCVEQYRKEVGRRRYPKALRHLSGFDRRVFSLYYWKGYPLTEITNMLAADAAREETSVPEAMDRIRRLGLRRSKTWVDVPPPIHVPYDEACHTTPPGNGHEDGISPAVIRSIVEQLPEQERLVIRLRFWEDLAAPEIAEIIDVSPRRVYTLIDRALRSLRRNGELVRLAVRSLAPSV